MSPYKISIGLCTGGTIRTETCVSLIQTLIYNGNQGIAPNVLFQNGGYVDVNRNQIAKAVLTQEIDYLMFIDNDMIFPQDAIYKLLKHDKDVVGANYNSRIEPLSDKISQPTVKKFGKNGQPEEILPKKLPKKLFKCYAVPTGFMLIKTKVLEKIEFPYFEAFIDSQGAHHTEDVDFCRKVNEKGMEVYCDPTIEIGHVGNHIY